MPPGFGGFSVNCYIAPGHKKSAGPVFTRPTLRGPEIALHCQNEQLRPHADMI